MTAADQILDPTVLASLQRLEFVSRKIFRGQLKGERRSRRRGQSVEFADYRNYVAGDDLRFLDWNLYARLDRLFLRIYLEEEELHFYTLIDASASMDFGEPTKFLYAQQLAAALGFIGLCRGHRVQIEPFHQSLRGRGEVFRGRQTIWKLAHHLGQLEPNQNAPINDSLKRFCIRNSGKGILVVISDFLDKGGYEPGLRCLAARELDVFLIHVLSPAELAPDIQGDLKLVDCEDADIAEISVTQRLLDRYQQTLRSFQASLREYSQRRQMTYLSTSTSVPVQQLVTAYLRQKGLVG